MSLLCVPLNAAWTGPESGLDLRAIYARRRQDNWGDPVLNPDGTEQWDTTGPLPLRRHEAWVRKGFQYITLADEDSLVAVAKSIEATTGRSWRDFIQNRRTRSPFDLEKWLAGRRDADLASRQAFRDLVAQIGLDAVTVVKRADQPEWQVPAWFLAEQAATPPAEPVKRKYVRKTADVAPEPEAA